MSQKLKIHLLHAKKNLCKIYIDKNKQGYLKNNKTPTNNTYQKMKTNEGRCTKNLTVLK